MRALVLCLLAAGCASDAGPIDVDASFYGPPPEAGSSADCLPAAHGGDPTMQCLARWDCAVEGPLTLVCGSDIGPAGPACACVRDGVDPVVVGLPTSCEDLATVTQFARQACGWSFL